MRKLAAYRVITLALLLAVSHIEVAQHEASHSEADLIQCELCFSHAKNPVAVVQSGHHADIDFVRSTHWVQVRNCLIHSPHLSSYNSRAPPLSI